MLPGSPIAPPRGDNIESIGVGQIRLRVPLVALATWGTRRGKTYEIRNLQKGVT